MQPVSRANQQTFVTWRREAIFLNIYHIKESVNYEIKKDSSNRKIFFCPTVKV